MKRLMAAGLVTLLAGCAHQIALTPVDGVGPIGRGVAPWKAVGSHGPLSIDLGGKLYQGEYVLQNSGGFIGAGTAFTGAQVSTATMYGASANGNGKAYLTEPGGAALSCDFSFSSMSGTGIGRCRGSDGRSYNMMIR